ncbi:hypothetical protein A3C96_04345 [Candidatus Uhrbacteria bacterium RIFCSPHIGHO2_02_FULL_60_10]|uniref:Rieske domain-containing protein n=1 Tax=Candidatus Uhrbacteria bacterium RIFCSPHIGHO2_02_FULL_60_10 TaxID=1802392 RepID=A0A1F7UA32_9BACT|nr:MAG: hypothetical protein A3C96_04345 [Candidatus Uhrbacteria bacterium RIFCSPHIGHO2_02_FULL_60_10]
MAGTKYPLGKLSEIPTGQFKKYPLGDRTVVVLNLDGQPKAYLDYCPHMGGQMRFDGKRLKCALHGALFDAETGMGKSPPVEEGAKLTAVKLIIEGDELSCELPERGPMVWSDEV